MASEYKNLRAVYKFLKRVAVYISSKTCFVIAPANKLKDQVRRILHWSEILCQTNQEILKASKIMKAVEKLSN